MNINLEFDSSAGSAPTGFKAAFTYAAAQLGETIASTATINIAVGYGEIDGAQMAQGAVGQSVPLQSGDINYRQLVAHAGAIMPPPSAASYYVTSAQQKAWGLIPASTALDGAVGVSSEYSYAMDPMNRSINVDFDLIGIAQHEITEAMGRIAGDGLLDRVNYAGVGKLATPYTGGYFSTNAGVTNLQNFSTSSDPADFQSGAIKDPFDAYAGFGTALNYTQTDQRLMSAIGFAQPTQFTVTNMTVGTGSIMESGTLYAGPVAGLTNELIQVTSDNINVVSHTPSSFIKTSAGDDAIDVSAVGGNNVLDGGTGSNFLTGGAGNDTFFLDDRQSAVTWSTINGFHAGDAATVWGITPADFSIKWLNGGGASGYTGLTASITAAGKPDATLTLAGFTPADLGPRLAVSFGATADRGGLAGSSFMQIRGV